MSAQRTDRTERLLNVVICLLATRRWLTKEQIRAAVPQYGVHASAEAFDRMFERDKDDLRTMGIPLVVGHSSDAFDDEPGYRIDPDAYALPPITFSAAELAALRVASSVWTEASWAGAAARGITKVMALGVRDDSDAPAPLLVPSMGATEVAFDVLFTAIRERQAVSFSYRKPGADPEQRRLEPWRLLRRGGWWYVVGYDLDREQSRSFRLSRMPRAPRMIGQAVHSVPASTDPPVAACVPTAQLSTDPADARPAWIAVRPDRGVLLRSQATLIAPGDLPIGLPHPGPPGWDVVTLAVTDVDRLSHHIADLGADAVVLAPSDVRAATIALLRGAAHVHAVTPSAAGAPDDGGARG